MFEVGSHVCIFMKGHDIVSDAGTPRTSPCADSFLGAVQLSGVTCRRKDLALHREAKPPAWDAVKLGNVPEKVSPHWLSNARPKSILICMAAVPAAREATRLTVITFAPLYLYNSQLKRLLLRILLNTSVILTLYCCPCSPGVGLFINLHASFIM
jgi:hypothetical protein